MDEISAKYVIRWMNFFLKEKPNSKPTPDYYEEWIGFIAEQEQKIEALEAKVKALESGTAEKEFVTVTTTLQGECVAVTMQDIEGQIKKVIWYKASPNSEEIE